MNGIDKRACQEVLFSGVGPSSDCGLFLIKEVKFVVRTCVKIVGHRRLLILRLYGRGENQKDNPILTYTVFQSSNTFITYDHRPETKTHWRTAMLQNLERVYSFSTSRCAFYSKTDEERVIAFCSLLIKGQHWSDGFTALDMLQESIRERELTQTDRKRREKVRAKMKDLRPLPKDLEGWLRREVLPAYFFYDSKKGKAPVKGVCSACGSEFLQEQAKHNETGVCPCCGRLFTMKSNGRHGRLWDRVTASVVQRYDEDKLIVRIVKGSFYAKKGDMGEVDYYEKTRIIIGMGKDGKPYEEPYHDEFGFSKITTWRKGYPPVMYLYQSNFNAETCGFLYCKNLDRELRGTPWQYCQLKAFYNGIQDEMQIAPYLRVFRMIPAIEFFVKLRLYWLVTHLVYKTGYSGASSVINLQGRNLREVLQIEPVDLPILQQPGAKVERLMLLRAFRRWGYQPDADFFDWAEQYSVCDERLLERALHYATPYKVMRYLKQQFVRRKADSSWEYRDTVSDYKDYLCSCEKLGYNLKDEFILFPKNLEQAHDQTQCLVRLDEVKRYDKQIAADEQKLKKRYQFEADGLVVLPPHTAGEIVSEGQRLHHCVGSYVESVVKKDCVILFIRKAEDKLTPFYTVEVHSDKVSQVRGANNCVPTSEVKEFLDLWKAKKHLDIAA